jgi:hypothetical protein
MSVIFLKAEGKEIIQFVKNDGVVFFAEMKRMF